MAEALTPDEQEAALKGAEAMRVVPVRPVDYMDG